MTAERPSPWWYRHRGLCIAAIFFLSFFAVAVRRPGTSPFGVPIVVFVEELVPVPHSGLWLAALLCCGAFAFRLWGASYLGRGVVLTRDTVRNALAVSGPFRFTRNPLYFGNVLLALGFGTYGPWLALVTATFGMILFSYALIRVEERDLRESFGDRFKQYAKAVPRLVPSLWPKLPDLGTQPPSLINGLRTELFVSAPFALLTIAIAITGTFNFTILLASFATAWIVALALRAITQNRTT